MGKKTTGKRRVDSLAAASAFLRSGTRAKPIIGGVIYVPWRVNQMVLRGQAGIMQSNRNLCVLNRCIAGLREAASARHMKWGELG